ncbi:RNA polymerase factor sigma-54 [Curvibacter sp. APW13]|uniref:RNA polymerase factor sigma-54 n=1 Tax=Curvibacter sp. APW13 TaxID=3077236 RepID=UPI0028DFCC17|nr:RNA polymerase factor sigma-54 [Curvibacter sp. APW13]MDT8990838.1 RNA polymerase factor sigma-54 [Curvibacter sp. APW13]
MKQGLSLRVSQHLALTPQLQQSIRLLQLSTLELSQEVDQMLDDNPFLERNDESADREDFGIGSADTVVSLGDRITEVATSSVAADAVDMRATADFDEETSAVSDSEPDWEGDGSSGLSADDSEWGVEARARNGAQDEELTDPTERQSEHETLQAHLHRQALRLRLSPEDSAALRYLIECLDDDGYLTDSLEDLARGLGAAEGEALDELVHRFTMARGLLQNLDPTGVGAGSLQECLQLQLHSQIEEALDEGTTAEHLELLRLCQRICALPLDLMARRDIKRLVQLCEAKEALVREAMVHIARLEPKPGRRFVDVERNTVVPDVLVQPLGKVAGSMRFRIQINPEVLPKIRVHDVYASALRGHRNAGDAAGHAAMQQRLQEARWFIKNIQQRFDTILRVSTAIVERQKNFFTHGELAMRPLVLREIADELGLHESTISRVTTAKYMATPLGTFELKYFFGSGLGTDSGGNASSTAVRALIKQFIASESPKKPLSDNQLSDMLKEQGIECARRTVAKYREGLKIPVASLRKAL